MITQVTSGISQELFDDFLEREARISAASNGPALTITDEYKEALKAIMLRREHVFITGGAGVGKTTFIKTLVLPMLNHFGINFAVTATTGLAGSHLDGKTIHSWSGIGLGPKWGFKATAELSEEVLEAEYDETYSKWLSFGTERAREGIQRRINSTDVLIIDEISMLHGNGMLGYLDYFLKRIRGNEKHFGGIQIIMVGDFCQLPPVTQGRTRTIDWAFTSHIWHNAEIKVHQFTHVFRQSDLLFSTFLNNRRAGIPLSEAEHAFISKYVRLPAQEDLLKLTFLVSNNKEADEINDRVLSMYAGDVLTIPAKYVIGEQHTRFKTEEKIKEELCKLTVMRNVLKLKVGLPVLITINDTMNGEYVNGTKAFVKRWTLNDNGEVDRVIVEINKPDSGLVYSFSRAVKCMDNHVKPEAVETYNGRVVPATPQLHQFPLIPASAVTIHKMQGASLDDAVIDLDNVFECGQAYVAMSRLRSLEGLYLIRDKFENMVHPDVEAFYASL